MLSQQDGRCAICGRKPAGKRLSVDHNHDTGAVRGLLCNSCNLSIGMLRDDARLLRAAADYLEAGS